MRRTRLIGFLIVGNMALLPQAMAQKSAVSGATYTCTDAAGRNITSDRPIPQCANREQRILGPTGVERGRIAPALSDEEKAAAQAQARKAQLAQQQAKEQRRSDAALLARYPARQHHDAARAQSLANVKQQQEMVDALLADIAQERIKLQQEMEFYAKDPSKAPARLRAALSDLDQVELAQMSKRLAHNQEATRIQQRFDAEVQRLLPLWSPGTAASPSASNLKAAQ